MKKIWLGLPLLSLLALPVAAQEKQEKEEKEDKVESRVENAGKVLKEILNAPDSIPQDVLDKADCVVILPSVLKFAIGFGGSYGRGVMTCRAGDNFRGPWGPPTMMALEGSTLRADNSANKKLYGKEIMASEIVFKHAVQVPPSAKALLATLQKASPKNKSTNR